MIEDPHPDQPQRRDQFLGDGSVGRARFWVSTGVVVGQDGRPGVDGKGCPDDFPGVKGRAAEGAGEEPFAGKDLVPGVQSHDVELLVEERAQPHVQEVAGVFGVADATLPLELGQKEGFGGGQDVLISDGATTAVD